jgi:nitrate reductase alpha subunit
LDANCDPESIEKITWAPQEAVQKLARQIAKNMEKKLFAVGMGPNHFFNNDLKDRAIFLLAALTRNIGYAGGNVGSFAGNYRAAFFNGLPQYILENPFDIELDPAKPARIGKYYKGESAHYFNYGERPLRVGNTLFTGKTHMPTPTKSLWFCNGNSILGNLKWHYDAVVNTLPKIEAIFVNEWWWTASCEYADIVFPVDSWAEMKQPDMTASVTNPFLTVYPRTPLKRLFNTRGDIETYAGVSQALAKITGDSRFVDYWRFVHDNNVHAYLQRIIDRSTTLRGYDIHDLEDKAKQGIPALLMTSSYPKWIGYEQTQESQPWYTRSGRLEFYRDEDEFIAYGENLPVYREPVDATHHEPNVILAKPHPLIKPTGPESYGIPASNRSAEVRQIRNVMMSADEIKRSKHPLRALGYTHPYITPKYRHGAHTTPIDIDMISVWFGPFGDLTRRDKRMPWVGEGFVDLNPDDAVAMGITDGDYVWIDGDPEDRPYRGWKKGTDAYHMSRCMMRARFYPGMPRGIARSWFNMYGATYGSVIGHESNGDKLARNPKTGYQAMFRYGSHQSATRAWLRPTLLTDSMVRKDYFGQNIGAGFELDVYGAVGAPKESFVKITKAEPGGIGGIGVWGPAAMGIRPTLENASMRLFLEGGYVRT